VVQIFEVGESLGNPFLTLEYASGREWHHSPPTSWNGVIPLTPKS
jgi:hypothetical protein